MNDSVLNRFLTPGSSFQELLPVAALFLIIWCMVWVALTRMGIPRRVAVVLSICVTLLALSGIRDKQLEWLTEHYAVMAILMLVTLAAAIRFFWRKAVSENANE